ncbi:RIP metalloprotease RseP [soil metagenome]
MEALVMAGQLILGLTILVGIHELGHMLTAKWFGMRVEKFAIGFPPKVAGKKIGETEYMIGLIPLGGFVKITGMVDESLDTEALSEEPKPYEFRAKPAWQRLIVMMGGIILNVLLGILIFIFLTYSYGESYLPASEARYGIVANELGQQMGFQTGDKIVAVNGEPIEEFYHIYDPEVLVGRNSYYTVDRNGQTIDIRVPLDMLDRMQGKRGEQQRPFVEEAWPFEVGEVVSGRPASRAGLQEGDVIKEVGGQEIQFFHELRGALQEHAGQITSLTVHRGAETQTLTVAVEEDGTIGFQPKSLLTYSTREYSLAEAIPIGTSQAFGFLSTTLKGIAKIFRGEVSASKSLSGPIGIAQVFGGTFNWYKFWSLVGMLSMWLAFFNFLPIPALDGGHVAFLTYEMVSGQKPSDNFLETAQKAGMVVLLTLMAFVIFNDVFKLFN